MLNSQPKYAGTRYTIIVAVLVVACVVSPALAAPFTPIRVHFGVSSAGLQRLLCRRRVYPLEEVLGIDDFFYYVSVPEVEMTLLRHLTVIVAPMLWAPLLGAGDLSSYRGIQIGATPGDRSEAVGCTIGRGKARPPAAGGDSGTGVAPRFRTRRTRKKWIRSGIACCGSTTESCSRSSRHTTETR